MSTIQSLGIGSGLKIEEIVTAITDAERVPKEQSLTQKEELTNAKISAYGEMKSRLSTFQTAVSALKNASNYNQKNATSADESAFTATASSIASDASYSIRVESLAQAQSIASKEFNSVDTIIGTGSIDVKFGTLNTSVPYDFTQDPSATTQTITVDGSNNTLASLKDHINNNDYGFTAAIVNNGSGFQLVFTAESGVNNALEFTISGDADGDDNTGLSQLSFDSTLQSLTQNIEGKDSTIYLNGIKIESETNTVANAVNGITIELKGETTSAKNLTINTKTDAIKEQVSTLVESYNEFISYTAELTAFSSVTGEGSLLLGDSTTRNIVNKLRETMFSRVSGISTGLQALSNIGILSSQGDGSLTFDEAAFDKAMTNSSTQFQGLFSTAGTSTDANIQFVSNSSFTQAGTYDIAITQLASKATYASTSVLPDFAGGATLDVNSLNDEFNVRIDGVASGTLTLAPKTYTSGATLARDIQDLINNSDTIASNNLNVTVAYDATNNRLNFESGSYGASSGISFLSVDTNSAAELGLFVGSGTAGTNVAGTINGVAAVGEGQFLSATSGDAKGLKIGVLGGAVAPFPGADRGSVTFTRGIADQLDGLLDNFLEDDGFLNTRLDGLDETLSRISEDKEDLEFAMERLTARLFLQFNAIDGVVGQLNSLSAFLTSALESLPGAKKKE